MGEGEADEVLLGVRLVCLDALEKSISASEAKVAEAMALLPLNSLSVITS